VVEWGSRGMEFVGLVAKTPFDKLRTDRQVEGWAFDLKSGEKRRFLSGFEGEMGGVRGDVYFL
jgi:hypothetical protein